MKRNRKLTVAERLFVFDDYGNVLYERIIPIPENDKRKR